MTHDKQNPRSVNHRKGKEKTPNASSRASLPKSPDPSVLTTGDTPSTDGSPKATQVKIDRMKRLLRAEQKRVLGAMPPQAKHSENTTVSPRADPITPKRTIATQPDGPNASPRTETGIPTQIDALGEPLTKTEITPPKEAVTAPSIAISSDVVGFSPEELTPMSPITESFFAGERVISP